jgi:hypothetical protein
MTDHNLYKIVGFDLRQKPLLDLGGPKKLGEYWPTDGPPLPSYPPTISAQTWPQSERCEGVDYPETNGINLHWLPDAQIADANAISVAFSLRTVDAEVFDKKSWVLLVDETHLSESFGWRLLGYDVADSDLGYSGFYGFTWKPGEMLPVFEGLDVVFNRHGLVDSEALAVEIAARLTAEMINDHHNPFYPVRVWIQDRTVSA